MKNKNKTVRILDALAYLISRQNLSADEVKELVIKTANQERENKWIH